MKHVDVLEVFLWGERVGAAFIHPQYKAYGFEFDGKWTKRHPGVLLSPLFGKNKKILIEPNLPHTTYHGLPAFLADCLPDEFGNQLITSWMSKRGFLPESITSLDRLAYLSKRAMGALEFSPHFKLDKPPTAIEMSSIVEAARSGLSGNAEDSVAIKQLLTIGTSAGGQRAKACVAYHPGTGKIHSPLSTLKDGFEHWLIKLDGVVATEKDGQKELGTTNDFGRVEYAYYLMSKDCGIEMSDCRLLEENGRAHFMTKRFDRQGDQKIHTQTLCAMAHMDYKQIATHDYNQLFMTLHSLGRDSDFEQAFRRMVFNALSKNCDDHTKNFSFCLGQNETEWSLSPAYDVCYAYSAHSKWVSQHLMSINGHFKDISDSDFMKVAERFEINGARDIIGQVRQSVMNFDHFAKKAGVNTELKNTISCEIGAKNQRITPKGPK